jgi:hypothetical protein
MRYRGGRDETKICEQKYAKIAEIFVEKRQNLQATYETKDHFCGNILMT